MFGSSRKFSNALMALTILSVIGVVGSIQHRSAFAQATIAATSFEEPTTGNQYVDTGDASVDHALVNNPSQSPVNYTSTGGELGFSSFYFNTRNDVGLTDGDFVGVTSFTGDVGSFPDGTKGFQMQDADGKMQTSLDAVDISSFSSVQVSLALFVVDTGWETDDVIHIFVETDAGTVDLLNTTGQDIDNLGIEGSWQTLQDTLPATATTATLRFALDSNAAQESIYLDNIQFTGEAVSTTPILVINEIMQNPSAVADASGEWFELYNPTNVAIDIDGWTIRDDGSDSHVINNGGPLNVPADGYLVLCNNATSGTNGGLACDYSYGSSWFLANGDDEVALLDTSATEIDRVAYDGGPNFPDPNGASMCLTDPTADNNIGSNWIESTTAYGGGDLGTPGAVNDCIAGAETAPSVTTTTPADNATDVPVGNNITINFSENVDLTANAVTLECPSSTVIPFTGLPASAVNSVTLDPTSDLPAGTVCTVTVVAAEVTDADSDDPPDTMETDFSFSFTTNNPALACTGGTLTLISAVQGSGAASGMTGSVVTVEGVVVGDFQDGAAGTSGDLNGFYLQEETADEDGNEATSEGIFVFQGNNPAVDVNPGSTVRVTGEVAEFNGLTELTNLTTVEVCPTASTIADVTQRQVTLPYTDPSELERYENMYVLFPQALVISEYFNYDRFGEMVLAVPLNSEDRPYTPTAIEEPGSSAAADRAADNLRSRITLDDGLSFQNPDPVRHPNGADFSLANTFRGGDQVQNATGVLTYDFGLYRIQPTAPATYIPVNSRPAQPDDVGGTLKVASFNVLNYFNGDGLGGGFPTARGADSIEEFQRQETKIVTAIIGTGADIVGLIEIENDPTSENSALDDLVDALNAAAGADTFDYIPTGIDGTDEIKVALIYKPAAVTPLGTAAVLDATSFTDPANTGTDKNRPALAQTFVENSSNGAVTVVVNHLKSKGSGCGAGDDDPEQGSCNLTRTLAAQALADWLATDPTGSGDPDFLVLGDLNAYDKEDPIDALKLGADDTDGTADDFTDLLLQEGGEFAYSYVFDGQFGYLDYALANGALLPQVTGATAWHINADEPDILDYQINLDSDAAPERNLAWYEPTPYRSSDHDPIIVGLNLAPAPGQLTVTKVVINDDGGTATVANFTLYAGNTQVASGVPATLAPGTYQISEAGPSGYRATFSGDCNAQGVVQLGSGESKSCTLTNNDIVPVTLSIANNVPGTPGGTASVDITYSGNGNPVSLAIFSIDFDESCLLFDPADANNDNIPDAMQFALPAGFGSAVQVDLNDLDGEIDITMQDVTPPFMSLPDGTLLTIDFQVSTAVACQPAVGSTRFAPVIFSGDPTPSFGDSTGATIPGQLNDGGVLIDGDAPLFGDCNGDNTVNAGDISALILEIFDGDGDFWTDTPGGTFVGAATCDANEDTVINAADISCTVLLIFNGPGACGSTATAEQPNGSVAVAVGDTTDIGLSPTANRLFLPIIVTAGD